MENLSPEEKEIITSALQSAWADAKDTVDAMKERNEGQAQIVWEGRVKTIENLLRKIR